MNFISTFDELNKLYEEADIKKAEQDEKIEEACNEELAEAADEDVIEDDFADEEGIPAEEAPAEEPVAEDEPRQVICECDKCGALVIKDEADIVVDEETDLVNVEDECQFCEEANGFKIVGVVVPYEAAAEAIEEPVEEEPVEESLHNSELLKEIEKTNELKTEHESEHLTLNEEADEEADDIIDEDLADVFRKKFDRPASVTTQQWWEEELTDLQLELEHETDERKKAKIEKRIKQLEDKFLQQRDWEARHAKKDDADELEELLDLNVPVNVTANGNDVAVGGMT